MRQEGKVESQTRNRKAAASRIGMEKDAGPRRGVHHAHIAAGPRTSVVAAGACDAAGFSP